MANDSGDEDFRVMDENSPQYDAAIERAVATLMEHFDSVQIVATKLTGTGHQRGTQLYAHGSGCYYSRVGSVSEWLMRREEETRREVWSEDDEPEEGEDWKDGSQEKPD